MKRFLLLLAVMVAVGGLASAQQGDQSGSLLPGSWPGGRAAADTSWIKTKYLDVAYASKSPAEKLDLYLPNEGKGPFPLIIEIHGGGFFIGEKSGQIAPMLEGLKRGYALASVGYRLSGEARFGRGQRRQGCHQVPAAMFPAAVNDVKAAIKFLRANAARYNLDPGGSPPGAARPAATSRPSPPPLAMWQALSTWPWAMPRSPMPCRQRWTGSGRSTSRPWTPSSRHWVPAEPWVPPIHPAPPSRNT